jgi:AcrR family transcriptional regulator
MPANSEIFPTNSVKPKPAKTKAGKRNPEKGRLDKATVVSKAAELLSAEGIEALSLHRVAKALGVQTPSLYNHIDGLPGLQRELTLLNARTLKERMTNAAMGKAGAGAVLAVMEAYRAYIKECPGLYLASVRVSGNQSQPDPDLTAEEEKILQVALATLDAFGLQREAALHAVRGLRSLVHGFATLEVGGGFAYSLDCDASFHWLIKMFVRGLEEETEK